MASKKKAGKANAARGRISASTNASLSNVISQNLINMAIVIASAGSVLLCLLMARRFT